MISIKPRLTLYRSRLPQITRLYFVTVDELLDYQLESHRIYYNEDQKNPLQFIHTSRGFSIHLKRVRNFLETSSRTEAYFFKDLSSSVGDKVIT